MAGILAKALLLVIDGLLERVAGTAKKRGDEASALFVLVVCCDPIPGAGGGDGLDAVEGAEVELLGHPDAHVVQAVEEGKRAQAGRCDAVEVAALDAVGRVEDGFAASVDVVVETEGDDHGRVVVEAVVWCDEAPDGDPVGQRVDGGETGGRPVVASLERRRGEDAVKVAPAADQVGGDLGREDGGMGRHLEKGCLVAVVGKLVGHDDGVDVRRRGVRSVVGAPRAQLEKRAGLDVPQGMVKVGHGVEAGRDEVPLSAEPAGDVALRPAQPGIDEDVEMGAAPAVVSRPRQLQQPGGVAVEVGQQRAVTPGAAEEQTAPLEPVREVKGPGRGSGVIVGVVPRIGPLLSGIERGRRHDDGDRWEAKPNEKSTGCLRTTLCNFHATATPWKPVLHRVGGSTVPPMTMVPRIMTMTMNEHEGAC